MIARTACFFVILGSLYLPLSAQNTDPVYSEKVRLNATTFHKNFSTGDFDKNGPLVNEKIYVNSNNVIVIGRANFVQRIKRYSVPFPSLVLRDKVVIVDENDAALLYVMQGTQDGPYGPIPPSGNKINVYAAEFFTMDDKALMKELLTITQLDRLKEQISGMQKVKKYENVRLLQTEKTSPHFKKMLKNKLSAYAQNINARDWGAFKELFAHHASINVNGEILPGVQVLIDTLNRRMRQLPDVTYHEIRNVVEGDRGALGYEVIGTFSVPGKTDADGNLLIKTVISKEGIHFQFDHEGRIIDAAIVYNSDDLVRQMSADH